MAIERFNSCKHNILTFRAVPLRDNAAEGEYNRLKRPDYDLFLEDRAVPTFSCRTNARCPKDFGACIIDVHAYFRCFRVALHRSSSASKQGHATEKTGLHARYEIFCAEGRKLLDSTEDQVLFRLDS